MKQLRINHLACWTSIIIIDIFLYVWYNYFFFESWLENNNMNVEEFIDKRGFIPYAVSLVTTVLIVYVLAWLFVSLKVDEFQSGMAVALSIGFAFTFLNVLGRDMYLLRPIEITFIDGGASLIACIIAGAILGGWRKYGIESSEF